MLGSGTVRGQGGDGAVGAGAVAEAGSALSGFERGVGGSRPNRLRWRRLRLGLARGAPAGVAFSSTWTGGSGLYWSLRSTQLPRA